MTWTGILCIIISSTFIALASWWLDEHMTCNCCGKLLKDHPENKE